ncbi:LysR family transcriptional regulator [Furfurilactobacillus siliginis]|uniref:LysR family transcriptional regulator n=1 Tax=Furfurilactobacillus siliginis TaxID=348151 RepID=A0A0R2L730_9LACO|nr:LysR family transcriptional regulator [Furfurilactobacillus siliginis]KRN97200.1 malolactic fermentation transcriptional regulator [Furfurilactobacillus siliginis]GEK28662.1 LysR family transcriptional regulator [Furfurilactobacillus siliginis]
MNTRDLEYFVAVAKRQNFSAVATQFHVSQPTITVAIKRLETTFGDELVQRDRTHALAKLTRAGEILAARADIILQNLSLAEKEIVQARTETIRFGLPPVIGTVYFPKLAGRLLQDHLLDRLQTREAGSGQLLKELEAGEIDVALLGSLRPLQNNTLTSIELTQQAFRIIVSKRHPLATAKQISFATLATEKFVTLTDDFIHPTALKAYADAAGFTPKVIYRSPDINLIKELVANELAVGLLVEDAITDHDDVVPLVISDALDLHVNVSLAYRKGFVASKIQQQMINDLKRLGQ